MAGTAMTRRTALAAGALAAAGVLAGCSRKTEVDRIAEANAAIIADLDLSQTRLPLGSVVETRMGRFMVAGHKCVDVETGESGKAVRIGFDYYGIAWPLGIQLPKMESFSSVLFNVSDITAVLFIGLVNEEDKDLRAYVDGYTIDQWAPGATMGDSMRMVSYSEVKVLEQQLRMQGIRSDELYGAVFTGGLLHPKATE